MLKFCCLSTTTGGTTSIVQSADTLSAFGDLSSPMIIRGSGEVTTTYTDSKTTPSRFYRIIQP